MIKIGDKLPKSKLFLFTNGIMQEVITNHLFFNKKVILFGMPGAFTPTCSNYHIPSIIDQIKNFKTNGIDDIYCLVVNDIHVTKIWAEKNGITNKGLNFLADPVGNLVTKMELSFNDLDVGFINRSKRFSMILNNLTVEKLFLETERGVCKITSGQNVLNYIKN